jgi:hypothetical protein
MSSTCCSPIRFALAYAGSTVSIECLDQSGTEIVSYLFPHAAQIDPSSVDGSDFRIRALENRDRLALYRGDQIIYLGDSRGHLAEVLMGEVCRDLVIGSRGGVVYHAGLVERDAISLLLPGVSGAGKSTLTAWLCSQGWSYHTDELVYAEDGRSEMVALARPLSLKGDPRALLPELPWEELAGSVWPSASGVLIGPRGLNPRGDWRPLGPGRVLFGRYSAEEPQRVERLSPARTAFLLLQSLVNGPNLAGQGMQQAVALARRLAGHEIVYSHLSQLQLLADP